MNKKSGEKKVKQSKKIASILIIGLLVLGSFFAFAGCKKEETPWWKDYENMKFVITDSRSETEDYIFCRPNDKAAPVFEYIDSVPLPAEQKEELIPPIKMYYKEEEKAVSCRVRNREVWTDRWEIATVVKAGGKFRVSVEVNLDENVYGKKIYITGIMIYINIYPNKK